MNFIRGLFGGAYSFYSEINGATLTGAIDVIVVEQPDGTFTCSPFHVRFGKMGVLRSREKVVDIEINGEPVDIHMKLGETGEAFFVEEIDEDEDVTDIPSYLATSPIPDGCYSPMEGVINGGSNDGTNNKQTQQPVDTLCDNSNTSNDVDNDLRPGLPPNFHPYSDGEVSPTDCGSPKETDSMFPPRPISPLSDSELEHHNHDKAMTSSSTMDGLNNADRPSWLWGKMPNVPRKTSTVSVTATPTTENVPQQPQNPPIQPQNDVVVDINPSAQDDDVRATAIDDNVVIKVDNEDMIDHEEVIETTSTDATDVPVIVNGFQGEEEGSCPNIEAEDCTLTEIVDTPLLLDTDNEKTNETSATSIEIAEEEVAEDVVSKMVKSQEADDTIVGAEEAKEEITSTIKEDVIINSNYTSGSEEDMKSPTSLSPTSSPPMDIITENKSTVAGDHSNYVTHGKHKVLHKTRRKVKHYKKTLRLSTEQITALNLEDGPNDVVFSVTTAYQGTTRCMCSIFFWRHDDKLVISDIDGTITKSDVLGHIFPMIGKDWAQSGVTNLFTKIYDNGYKFIYLSARAIGQARTTREYLRSVVQGEIPLPDGPLLLSPTSLISAFHREVIEKKPEEFKISCLKDIQALFPTNPFCAGFGNKINDTWAYRAVGIPLSRIFTVNHRGELKLELIATFQSSYTRLSDVVDQMFPPLEYTAKKSDFLSEYSTFNYWKEPIETINEEEDDLIKSITSIKLTNGNNKTSSFYYSKVPSPRA